MFFSRGQWLGFTIVLHLFCHSITPFWLKRATLTDDASNATQTLMKLIHFVSLSVSALLLPRAEAAVGTISGPFSHRNLEIFLITGESQLEERHYFTLTEALEKKLVLVRETGNVQELTIENQSKHSIVFLNAGDIVKGGRQDRTVKDDLVLPPRSGRVAISAFCVEHGRWTKRGDENASSFAENNKVLTSRKLKLAARYGSNQSDVWSGVAEQQEKLNANVSALSGKHVDLRDSSSASSLQLTLENKELDLLRKQYLHVLSPLLDSRTDVIGFAYAINGELNSAEVYNNKNLFRALWPKLLDSAITEAITEYHKDSEPRTLQLSALKGFFETAVTGSASERTVWKTTRVKTYTTPGTVLFETIDLDADGAWIHKSFIARDNDKVVVPLDPGPSSRRQQHYPNGTPQSR
jgi:hypothetical protein